MLLALGCSAGDGPEQSDGPGDEDAPADPLDGLYAIDRVLSVDIELEPDDWDALRNESRNLLELLSGDCRDEPFGSPYTWFEASVRLDGETFAPVEVRKKGFIGSLSTTRPGLKVDLGEFEREWTFEGARRLTLNNAVSDDAVVRQCITYSAFADAGLPAPRCGFARVHVNGDDLGLYVNLEPIKEPFLARHWGDSSGNLYEGTLSDFGPGLSGTLEPKTNEDETDRSDIEGLVDALDVDDADLLESLDEHLDLDQFFTHWAMEVITKHQDGYAANTNNFYIYADPSDGRFDFIPWGTDDTLSPYWWDGASSPRSVFATGHLANRLYEMDEGQERYLSRLQALLDGTWDEARLLARLDRMEAALLGELADGDARALTRNIAEVRDVIEERRSEIEAELESGPARWRDGVAEPFCAQQTGSFDLTLSTTWGSLERNWYRYGEADLVLSLYDESVPMAPVGVTAGWGEDGPLLLVAGITP
ncbi:MAG: CotH kinase family protein, partial [Myxococcota bacterium]|nr:CotH kinase family protein [Myxococcota bacterium]